MRIKGTHPSGSRIEIIKNELGLFDLYCYDTNGDLFYESIFRDIVRGKSKARKQFNIQGQWSWDVILELKAQEAEKLKPYQKLVKQKIVKQNPTKQENVELKSTKIYISKIEAIVMLHKGHLINSVFSEGVITFKLKLHGIYEIRRYYNETEFDETLEKSFTNLKKIINLCNDYFYIGQ